MRTVERILLLVGIVCIALYAFFTVQTRRYQSQLEESFDQMVERRAPPVIKTPAPRVLKEGDIVGRLEIPRLNVSVMVMEGVASRTLRLGAGHIPGTALPGERGNAGIAAHRDTFFRPLSKIEKDDTITFKTVNGTTKYRVESTSIVKPDATHVLHPQKKDMITLVTCYPFRYVGSAPKRFIVHATRE